MEGIFLVCFLLPLLGGAIVCELAEICALSSPVGTTQQEKI